MENTEIKTPTPIVNDVKLSITVDYREDKTLRTFMAVTIAPPFDNQLSPLEQNKNSRSILIDSDTPRVGDIDKGIIEDLHNIVRKILDQPLL